MSKDRKLKEKKQFLDEFYLFCQNQKQLKYWQKVKTIFPALTLNYEEILIHQLCLWVRFCP